MSKSRTKKWYDRFDPDEDTFDIKRNKIDDRRKQKRLKTALKNKNLEFLSDEDEANA
jgi:hypothetical protein